MTFVLKSLEKLKEHFGITKDLMLRSYGYSNIKDLHEPRRSEMLLLQAVLDKIDEQIRRLNESQEKAEKIELYTQDYLSVYYGAMLVARHDTHDLSGKLAKRLADALCINNSVPTEEKPNLYHIAKFHMAFNAFLQAQLFKGGDLRQGLKEEHLLSAISNDDLKRLLKISYELEREAQQAVIATLAVDGKKNVDLKNYVIKKEIPASAIAPFKSFTQLREELRDLITEEYKSKNKATINELGQPRAAQLNFLVTMSELLGESIIKDSEKTAILAGAMHLVHQQIHQTYTLLSPERAVVYKGLHALLSIDETHPQDIEALLHATNSFIRFSSISTKPILEQKNGIIKSLNIANPFAKIDGLDLKEILNVCQKMICTCRDTSRHQIFMALKQDEKPEQPTTSSWISMSTLTNALPNFSFFKAEPKHDHGQIHDAQHESPLQPAQSPNL